MMINTTAIYNKAQAEPSYPNESLWVQAKSPDEKLEFYTRSKILIALYTKAFEVDSERKSISRRASSSLNYSGISHLAADNIIEKLEMRYKADITKCPYIFGPVNCGGGPVALEVCLKNVMEFDSVDFDKKYGDNAAAMAINSYIEKINQPFNAISLDNQDNEEVLNNGVIRSVIQQKSALRQNLRINAGLSLENNESPTARSPIQYIKRKSSLFFQDQTH
jgi:hypothetical protein